MEIIYKKVSEITPYENNPRFNDNAVQYVANSIKEFGFKVPIVIDKNNIIIAGHTRLKASIELGLKEVPCVIADDLTEEQKNHLTEIDLDDYEGFDIEIENTTLEGLQQEAQNLYTKYEG